MTDFCYQECYFQCRNGCMDALESEYHDYYSEEECAFYYEAATLQKSLNMTSFHSNGLLISEVLKQDGRMYVLASGWMLIADIDCGKNRRPYLKKLDKFVENNGGSFRVYLTKNGMRYIQTDLLYQGANKSAIATLKELGSDPQYVNLCSVGKRFMARLTPKLAGELAIKYYEDVNRNSPPLIAVTHFVKTVGTGEISNSLYPSVAYHDLITQANRRFLKLK